MALYGSPRKNSGLLYRADPGSKIIQQVITGKESWKVFIDKNKQIWVATIGGGLLQYDENKKLVHQFRHEPQDPYSIINDTLFGMFGDPRDDTLWIATPYGIGIMNTGTKKI